MKEPDNQIIIFKTDDEKISVDVRFDEETVWLTLDQMAALFERNKSTISRHIKNVFDDNELDRNSVVANFATTAADGKTYQVDHYNLDVIISIGYRVKSLRGTQFRQWATKRLNEYIRKGFTLDDERLKNGGGRYFRELLQRIRDIRSSERNLYQQVTDIYTTAIDYDPKANITMADWIAELDRQLTANRRELLTGKGSISHKQAVEKAEKELEIYRSREMKQLESDFDRAIKHLAKTDDTGELT